MSRPKSRPNFLQPARSAPAPASVTNTNVTAAMVSVPGDIEVDVDGPEYHDTDHRPSPGSVTAASTTGSTTTTTGRASSAFSLPFFAGSSASKRPAAPTVSSVSTFSTLPGQVVPVPNVHAQAYTGQQVPVMPSVVGSISGASTRTQRTATTGTGSSTSGASATTTTMTNARRAAPGFPPPSQISQTSPTSRAGVGVTHGQQAPLTPRTPIPHPQTPTAPSITGSTSTSGLATAQARTAVLASISNMLDRELTGRASLLHQNHNAILKQEREMSKTVEGFKKDNDKLEKLAREGTKRLKEVGDVQNWAEVLERGFLRIEETLARANGEWSGSGGSGSWTGSYTRSEGSGGWSGSEREDGREGNGDGDGDGEDHQGRDGRDQDMHNEGEGGNKDMTRRENDNTAGGVKEKQQGSGGYLAVEASVSDKTAAEEIERDAEDDVVMTTEDDVQERHTRLDKGKGKAVDDTIPDSSMVHLPQSPGFGGSTQFLSLTAAPV